jgi:hypothetical protein
VRRLLITATTEADDLGRFLIELAEGRRIRLHILRPPPTAPV